MLASTWDSAKALLEGVNAPMARDEPICRVISPNPGQVELEVPRLEKWSAQTSDTRAAVRCGGRYIVTGGNGGLGRICVQWLLGRGAAAVTILSRTEPEFHDDRIAWQRCDVSKASDLKAAAEQFGEGEVHGIIHAAGVLADKMLANQTEKNIRMAFAPKVLAALLLPKFFNPTDWLVFFSSASAVFGHLGQVPYSAANAALDAFSQLQSVASCAVLSLAWGPWKEVGMAAGEAVLSRARQAGIGAWTSAEGISILEHLLEMSGEGQISAVPIAWERFEWPTNANLTCAFQRSDRPLATHETRLPTVRCSETPWDF